MPGRVADEDRWEARAARARRLQPERPAAAEALDFYARLAAAQGSLRRRHGDGVVRRKPLSLPDDFARGFDIDALLPAASDLLAWMRREAPPPVARAAEEPRAASDELWRGRIASYLLSYRPDSRSGGALAPPPRALAPQVAASPPPTEGDRDSTMDLEQPTIFLVEALLQPFAEAVATSGEWAPVAPSGGAIRCPACTGLPVVGVLREKGHGAQRSFVCGLCFTEWPTLRLMCPACGEERFDRLPVFRAGGVGAARVDACDACRAYVKTIDLTEDGEAVPLVDDLASVPLDLWARGEGYARIRPNLLRL